MENYDYKVLMVYNHYTDKLETLLKEGWEIQHITAFAQPISMSSNSYGRIRGDYGAYVILRKEKKELTEEEVKAKLIEKGLKLWE